MMTQYFGPMVGGVTLPLPQTAEEARAFIRARNRESAERRQAADAAHARRLAEAAGTQRNAPTAAARGGSHGKTRGPARAGSRINTAAIYAERNSRAAAPAAPAAPAPAPSVRPRTFADIARRYYGQVGDDQATALIGSSARGGGQ